MYEEIFCQLVQLEGTDKIPVQPDMVVLVHINGLPFYLHKGELYGYEPNWRLVSGRKAA